MVSIPSSPKIFHITHLDNLKSIASSRQLISDAKRIQSGLSCSLVGMSTIKKRRLEEIEVSCHSGTTVGEYVPFYFCPRSIMLYILHRGNHPDLNYRDGQKPIVHLQADLKSVISWAIQNRVKWSFSNCNASARYAKFFNNYNDLSQIDWDAVASTNFQPADIKEKKQAEFLVFDVFPWTLVEKIGTINNNVATQALSSLRGIMHQPNVSVEPTWYF